MRREAQSANGIVSLDLASSPGGDRREQSVIRSAGGPARRALSSSNRYRRSSAVHGRSVARSRCKVGQLLALPAVSGVQIGKGKFMFGRNKRSGVVRIDSLARAAQATIGMALMRHYGVGRAAPAAPAGAEDNTAKKAAAAANFLNGHPPHPMHAGLDLPQVQAEAREWIRKNIEMRELVVQTLRVAAVVHPSAKSKDGASEESLSILSEFGGDSTDAPDPRAYEALVRRAIATLPHDTQIQLMRLTKTDE